MSAALVADNLTKRFGTLTAVDSLSLSVTQGELFGLVGSDGAGKTTTLRMFASVLDPTSGSASVLDLDTVQEAEAVKGEIGYMSQRFGLYQDLTVLENIHFYADIYGLSRKGRVDIIERLLSFSNLAPFKKRLAGNLSGGMKQKLGLACALVHTPRVLLLDEPTNGVDPVSRRDFWRILYQLLRQGVTIFVATAYLDEAERCSRVGLIHKGKLLACDTPQALKSHMPERILEVRAPGARTAAHFLRERLGAESVGLFGDRLHVVTPEPERTGEEVRRILKEHGIEAAQIRPVEPSLEDVFVAMLREETT